MKQLVGFKRVYETHPERPEYWPLLDFISTNEPGWEAAIFQLGRNEEVHSEYAMDGSKVVDTPIWVDVPDVPDDLWFLNLERPEGL